jgi:hypothetical protein
MSGATLVVGATESSPDHEAAQLSLDGWHSRSRNQGPVAKAARVMHNDFSLYLTEL